ncbi:MAG: hypothetical protein ACRYHA_26875 [Janthinobacterium lividum]
MQRFILPYLCGFLAVLFFQQATIGMLHAAGLSAIAPFALVRIDPFGLPEFIVDGIASGVYAVVMAWLLRVDPQRPAPWLAAFVYGGIVPTAMTIFVQGPLQGRWPTGNILPEVAFGFATNAMWGWGTLALIRAMSPAPKPSAYRQD